MNEERIKRILVAIDASESNKSILKAATQLAQRLNAQLQTLFVEDINLLRMAQLPIAREITASAHTRRPLNLSVMEQQLRSQVERLRRVVAATAQQSNLTVDFKVLRGQIANELCTAVQDMDLLVVGKNTQLQRYSEKLGAITKDMLLGARCNLLLMRHGATLDKPVALLYTGSDAGKRALHLAMALAHGDEGRLNVIYPAVDKKQLQIWQAEVTTATKPFDIAAKHTQLQDNTIAAVLAALAQHNARVLVITPQQTLFDQAQLQHLISRCQTPLLLVR